MRDRYGSFHDLSRKEKEGRDYRIVFANEGAPVLIMAPHGGEIEPGTTELARAIAGKEWGFYSFCGTKQEGNFADLHITSTRFDEPRALRMAASSLCTVTVHGCRESSCRVYVGGRDSALKEGLRQALVAGGFAVAEHSRYAGTDPANICNKNRSGKGVQLEVTRGLRRLMFPEYPRRERTSVVFDKFVAAVRHAVGTCLK